MARIHASIKDPSACANTELGRHGALVGTVRGRGREARERGQANEASRGKGRLALQGVKPPDRSSLAHHPEVEQNLVLLGSSSRRKSINQSDTQTPWGKAPLPRR